MSFQFHIRKEALPEKMEWVKQLDMLELVVVELDMAKFPFTIDSLMINSLMSIHRYIELRMLTLILIMDENGRNH